MRSALTDLGFRLVDLPFKLESLLLCRFYSSWLYQQDYKHEGPNEAPATWLLMVITGIK